MNADIRENGAETVPSMFWARARERGAATMLRQKELGVWKAYSWHDVGEVVADLTAGLIELGLRPGDFVSILSNTSKEWIFVDLGAQCAGAIVCGLHTTSSAAEIEERCVESLTRFLFVEDEEQLDKLFDVLDRLVELRHVFVLESQGAREPADPRAMRLADLVRIGAAARSRDQDIVARGVASRAAGDIAILAYTSGTTGSPKGVLLTHRNVLAACHAMRAGELGGSQPGGERLLFASLCQIAERIGGVYLAMLSGAVMNFVESEETVLENLREVQPDVLMATPRVWEKIGSEVSKALAEATPFERWAHTRASDVGREMSSVEEQGRRPGLGLRVRFWLARALVLDNVRRSMGLNRLRMGLSRAAPMPRELLRWYLSLGLDLREIWGMTELTGAALVTSDRSRPGRRGAPLPSLEVALSEIGEILVRGPTVFAGYLNRPEEARAVAEDGWMRTGDLGRLDERGCCEWIGRAEDAVITANGERWLPSDWESELRCCPYIFDALVVGGGGRRLVGLILIDHDNVEKWALSRDIAFSDFPSLARASEVRSLIAAEIDAINQKRPPEERIGAFRLMDAKLGLEDEEFTPTMTLRRRLMREKYAEVIEALSEVEAA
jgi:long-chain acyl-CoA synthetase